MSWQDDKEYKQAREDLERCHQKAVELGVSNPATEAGELVLLEMRFAANDHRLAQILSHLVFQWKSTNDPYYMDKALIICNVCGVMPSPALIDASTEAAMRRYTVGHSGLKATASGVEREYKKWQAFTFMMNLIYRNASLSIAASKAARWMKDVLMVEPLKASTLDKYYAKEIRDTGIEKEYFEKWDKWKDCENETHWANLIAETPEADEDLKGNRRE